MFAVSRRYALQCVGLALAQWQLLCGLFLRWRSAYLHVMRCGDVSA